MGAVSAGYFYTPVTVETKGDKTFVTQADRQTEQAARTYLNRHRSHDKVWGEEFGKDFGRPVPEDITWVIDPIDGTKAFMDGLAYWTNLIAVFRGAELLFGLINQPVTGERYWGGPLCPSRYAYTDPQTGHRAEMPIQCADVVDINRLMWRSTTRDYMEAEDRRGYDALAQSAPPREGGDAMLYAALARGRTLNCVFDGDLAAWDIAGPAAVVLGAGGVVTDAAGAPLDFFCSGKTTVLAAATSELHQTLREILKDARAHKESKNLTATSTQR